MSLTNETLMAYVDDELEPTARAAVEAAMRKDQEIERRIEQMNTMRARLQAAYAAELAEPVPERLLSALRPPASSKIVDLVNARDSNARGAVRSPRNRSRWRYVTAMAASLLVAVGAGYIVRQHSQSTMITNVGGSLVAGGALAGGLSDQLAGKAGTSSTVDIGISFLAKSGDYCRTFSISGGAAASGLACRHASQWEIQVLTQSATGSGTGSEYRTAGSSLSPAILAAVQEEMSGDPLDRAAEIAARRQGWSPAGK